MNALHKRCGVKPGNNFDHRVCPNRVDGKVKQQQRSLKFYFVFHKTNCKHIKEEIRPQLVMNEFYFSER